MRSGQFHAWFLAIFLFCAAIFLSNAVHWVLFRILKRKEAGGAARGWGIQKYLGKPSRTVFMLTCLLAVVPAIPRLPGWLAKDIRHAIFMLIVCAVGWFLVGCVYVLQAFMLRKYDLTAQDNMQARRVHTQFQVFRHLLVGFVLVVTAGALLWTFNDPRLWHYGSGLLASAGVASLLLASAAKSTVSNVLAGIQIAFTEPIRIDDVVVVQGEWGRIEEITSAYVVVKIWDLRRLIVPLSYFIENPVENWTRSSSAILSYPYIYVDYSVPVAELRAEFERYVKQHPLWDGQGQGLQVTDLSAQAMQIRCLVTCRNASDGFNIGCDIREHMTGYIQQNYPDAFPTMRWAERGGAGKVEGEQAPKQMEAAAR
ncbi:MAG TPA: mechanosensitive ion channel domain-containing protein [Acidobacteriaceae bacterium]|nr:mechanosensitive ion channel domain-containing protein [Acidobacteriaceae bacterium]